MGRDRRAGESYPDPRGMQGRLLGLILTGARLQQAAGSSYGELDYPSNWRVTSSWVWNWPVSMRLRISRQ